VQRPFTCASYHLRGSCFRAAIFTFEGASLDATAKKVIEYAGEEIGGVTIYWDVNMALSAGQYTVELFADNFRLVSKHFELK